MQKLMFMYGNPGAGKTSLAKNIVGYEYVGADEIRQQLYGSKDTYGDSIEIKNEIVKQILNYLKQGHNVVYDGTNLLKFNRCSLLKEIEENYKQPLFKIIYRVNTDKETCIKKIIARNRDIPLETLLQYFDIKEPPAMSEGWDEILDNSFSSSKRFYIASPFFEKEHRENALKVTEFLRSQGHCVFLPCEHKIENAWDLSNQKWGKKVFENDIKGIKYSDAVIMLSYGRESTAGTNWEAGYAYGIGKKVIVVEMPNVELMSLMVANGRFATLKGLEELFDYNFYNMVSTNPSDTEQK